MNRTAANQVRSPAKRADAERNRDKILAAARAAFADPEAEVSMAEVSRRAGVGMATLYRNFPGRRELLEALYADEVNAVCQAAETVEGETPGAVFVAWLHRFFAFFTSKHPVGELLIQSYGRSPMFSDSRDRVLAAAGRSSSPRRVPMKSATISRLSRSLTWSSPSPRSTAIPATWSRSCGPCSTGSALQAGRRTRKALPRRRGQAVIRSSRIFPSRRMNVKVEGPV